MKTFSTFKDLSLPAPLHAALEKMNFLSPTPVQSASLPPGLEGKDILGTAQTGTGKTGAFGIPLIAKLLRTPGSRALILAPTRELAAQIQKVLIAMSHGTKIKGALLVGGEPFFRQKADVQAGADYYVCTPGRLIDHLDAGLRLDKVNILVLDEVDRMLDMGFAPQLQQIVPYIPTQRQTLLFSATLPKEILAVAGKYLQDPVRVSIGATSAPIDRVKQENHSTTALNKNELLLSHLKDCQGRVLIFARTQHRTNKVFQMLERNKFAVCSLHGGRTQGQRKMALASFRDGSRPFMVATDLAGRGIDVDDIELVINYDIPGNREDYIHRIGRTGRNGKNGTALNYITPADTDAKQIINPATPKGVKAPTPKPVVNKPGWEKGGWDKKGGKYRPEFHKRTKTEGYGNSFTKHASPVAVPTESGSPASEEQKTLAPRPPRKTSTPKRPIPGFVPGKARFGSTKPKSSSGFQPRYGTGPRQRANHFDEKDEGGSESSERRPAFNDEEGPRPPRRPFGAKPGRPNFGGGPGRPSFGERNGRPSFGSGPSRPSFGDRGGRPSFGGGPGRPGSGDRSGRPSFGSGPGRPSFGDRNGRPSFGGGPGRPSFGGGAGPSRGPGRGPNRGPSMGVRRRPDANESGGFSGGFSRGASSNRPPSGRPNNRRPSSR